MTDAALCEPATLSRRGWARTFLILAGIVAVAAYVYRPVLHGRFLNWDDDLHLTGNPDFNPPAWYKIPTLWDRGNAGLYIPVAYTTWMMIARATVLSQPTDGGNYLRAGPFHVANYVAHLL